MKWPVIVLALIWPSAASAESSLRNAYVAECMTWGGAFTRQSCACIFDDISSDLGSDGATIWVAEISPSSGRSKQRADIIAKRGQGFADKAFEKASVGLAAAMGRCRVPLD